jgi:hypothetical protein
VCGLAAPLFAVDVGNLEYMEVVYFTETMADNSIPFFHSIQGSPNLFKDSFQILNHVSPWKIGRRKNYRWQ